MNYWVMIFSFFSISLIGMETEVVKYESISYFPTNTLIYGNHKPLFEKNKSNENHDFQILKDDYKKLLNGAVGSIKQRKNELKKSNADKTKKIALDLITQQQKELENNCKKAKDIKNEAGIKIIIIPQKDIVSCLRWAISCNKVPETKSLNVVFLSNDLVTIHALGLEDLIERYRKKAGKKI